MRIQELEKFRISKSQTLLARNAKFADLKVHFAGPQNWGQMANVEKIEQESLKQLQIGQRRYQATVFRM